MARQPRASDISSRELFEKNPLPMWVFDLETLCFLAVNDAAVRQYGYSRREFLAMAITAIRPPEQIPALLEKVAQPHDGFDAAGTWSHRKKDGTIIEVEITTYTIRFAGRPARLVLANDVTERKRLEKNLHAAADEWRNTFDAMSDAVALIDQHGTIVRCNKAMTLLARADYREIIGRRCWEIVHGTPGRIPGCPVQQVLTTHARATATVPSGSRIYKVVAEPLFDAGGRFIGAVHIMSDVTAREQAESEIRAASDLLDAMSRVQSQVIVEAPPAEVFSNLLQSLIGLTRSRYGFIGEMVSGAAGAPLLRTHAITNIAWNEETRALYDRQAPHFEFTNLKTLFGEVIATGKAVIANDPARDPRRGGLPPGHPALESFLGLPIYHGATLVGMVGVANRPGGYDEPVVAYLQPLLSTCGSIIAAYRTEARRKQAEEEIARSEERYRDLFENAGDAIFLLDSRQRYLDANRKAEQLTGYAADELRSMSVYDLVPPGQVAASTAEFRKQKTLGAYEKFEGQIRRKDGAFVDVEVSSSAILKDGEFVGSRDIVRDITAQKRAEAALLEQQAFTERLIQGSSVATFVINDRHEVILWNKACEELTGVPASRMIGSAHPGAAFYRESRPVLADCVLDGDAEKLSRLYPAASRSVLVPEGLHAESWIGGLNGKDRYIVFDAAPIRDNSGAVIASIETIQDLTARKRAEEAIAESEERYRNLFDGANDMIQSVAPDGRFLYVNPAWRRVLGYGEDDLRTLRLFDIIDPGCKTYCENLFAQAMSGEPVDFLEARFVARDGRVVEIEGSANIRLKDGKVVSTQAILRDVTERKKLQEALYRISRDWEETFNSITDMVTVHDKDFNIIRANTAAGKILGLPFLQAQPVKCFEYYHGAGCPPAGCPSCSSLATGKPSVHEMFEPHLGLQIEVRAIPRLDRDGRIAGLIHVVRDITERTRSEAAKQEQMLLAEFGMHVGTALNKETALQEILGACTELMVNELGTALARIWTMSPDGQLLILQASSGIYTHRDGPHGLLALDLNLKIPTIARTRTPHLTNAVVGDPLVDQQWAAREGMAAFAGYPLLVGNHLVGVMGVFSRRMLSDFALNALESVANNIALGIERSEADTALKRYSAELSALNTASNDLLVPGSLPEICDGICRHAAQVFGVELVWLGLIDAAGVEVAIAGHAGEGEEYLRTLRVPLDDSPAGRGPTGLAIRLKQPWLSRKDSPEYAPWRLAAEQYGFETSLAVPLISSAGEGVCIGALNLYSRVAEYFTADRVRLCQIFANQAAVAIENARLIAGLEEQVDLRTREYESANIELQHVNQELESRNEELEENFARLRKLEALRDSLVHMIIHDLRNPLATAAGFLDILQTSEGERISEPGRDLVRRILRSTDFLTELINTMLDVSKLESGRMELNIEECDIEPLAREVVSRLESLKGARLLVIEAPAQPILVRGDPQLLSRLIQNLTGNALKFTPEKTGEVVIGLMSQQSRVRVTVRDNGPGIPPQHLVKVFDKFWQGEGRKQGLIASSGLGLTFCKMVVEAHGGTIGVESTVGQGSTFWFELPRSGPGPGLPRIGPEPTSRETT